MSCSVLGDALFSPQHQDHCECLEKAGGVVPVSGNHDNSTEGVYHLLVDTLKSVYHHNCQNHDRHLVDTTVCWYLQRKKGGRHLVDTCPEYHGRHS